MRPNRNPLRTVLRVSTEMPHGAHAQRWWTFELECGHEKVARGGNHVWVLPHRVRCRFCGVGLGEARPRSVEEEL